MQKLILYLNFCAIFAQKILEYSDVLTIYDNKTNE
jgi:hypothetical protein